MALTYKDIIEGAERIRTNELPESNTADLVGQQLKNMAEFFLSASSDIPELKTYLLQRLQGTSADSDALHDPQKWLGRVTDDEGLNALLDGMHGGASDGGGASGHCGYFRGDYEGSPFTVESIPLAYATDTWVQSVRGHLSPARMGTSDTFKGLTRSSTEYNILWRVCEKGTWGVWKSFTTGGGTAEPSYVAFDFGVLQEKTGSGRTQGDLDAFGLTEDVWAEIRGAEIMVVRDDAHERTYAVTGSSDDYISFQYGLLGSLDYEAYSVRDDGGTFTIRKDSYTGSGGGLVVIQ